MMRIKTKLSILLLLVLMGCIKAYDPQYKGESTKKFVVQGTLSSEEGWQEVQISRTSAVNNPQQIGVDDCQVKIMDETEHVYALSFYGDGVYRVWMDSASLLPGKSYRIDIFTADGQHLQSDFDQMPASSPMEEVFYEIKDLPTNEPEVWIHGIQFYTNLNAPSEVARYYRYQLTETWEYHSAFPLEYYYDGQIQKVTPPDYTEMVCWTTLPVENIFTLSTENLDNNSFARFPLNYVNNSSPRLSVLYSLNIRKIALSEDAFTYWDQMRINSSQDGGLYASQPLAIKGNMHNLTHPDQDVLGFFQASSVHTKRIFVEPVEGLELDFSNRCSPEPIEHGFVEISPADYPAYLMTGENGEPTMLLLNDECILCTMRGGTNVKPEYWPIK
jgi:hypothetical protein